MNEPRRLWPEADTEEAWEDLEADDDAARAEACWVQLTVPKGAWGKRTARDVVVRSRWLN
jgi:hypothetical protein